MLVKRFFFVSAGLLCLAFAYHLGASSATAQSGAGVDLANVHDPGTTAIIGRVFWYQGTETATPTPRTPPIPGTSAVVGCGFGSSALPIVVLANGEVWRFGNNQGGNSWELLATYPTGLPTAVQRSSWGGLKVQYHRTKVGGSTPAHDSHW